MVLDSQAPRPGMDRLYRVSGRRRRGGRSWLLMGGVLLVIAVAIYAIIFVSGFISSPETASGETDQTSDNAQAQATATEPTEPRETIRFTGTPVQNNRPKPQQPVVTPPTTRETPVDEPSEPINRPEVVTDQTATYIQSDPLAHPALAQASAHMREGELVQARRVLSQTLYADDMPPKILADALRAQLSDINSVLVFSDEIVPGDEIVERYRIQPGDALSRIGTKFSIPYEFIQNINGVDPNRIAAGKYLKVLRGPLHARVIRHQYIMDVFGKDPQGNPVHVISFPVGLGENNSTPDGMWLVEPGRKVANPDWRNPRTGEYYERDDPRNPIGEYWIALEGMDQNTSGRSGYGIHGTVEPDSIGSQASMGCVRLHDEDIQLVYYMLSSGNSTVKIMP